MIKSIKESGYEILKIKNTFNDGEIYMGINLQIKAPTGQVLELQFHTLQSFYVKQNINHILYEEVRVLNPNSKKSLDLINEMRFNSSKIEIPEGVNTIK